MFRARSPQGNLFQSVFLFPEEKARRLERSWAEMFQAQALPLIDEERFALMYCDDNGRPNRAVQTVLGVLVLKDMFNLTDEEALDNLEFNLLWHHALRLTLEEAHLPQKTLHNFRCRLMVHDGGRVAFCETTDRILQALGIRTGRQRLDSSHIMSNIAALTRLGLFCETIRLFLGAVRQGHPELGHLIPEGLAGRYLKKEGEATNYEDARSDVARRRLGVCARDLYRLVDRLRGTAAEGLDEYRLLERLLREQCAVGGEGDDDVGEDSVPISLKDPRQVRSDSLQSPHDAEATYSGRKGKGYEVQVAETCDKENSTQIITHVEVTPSSGSDADVPVPLIDALAERKIQPRELFADTTYGSGRNAIEAQRRGTELVSPVAGAGPDKTEEAENGTHSGLTAADFEIDAMAEKPAVCPAGQEAIEEYEKWEAPERVELRFARATCEACSLRPRCPVGFSRKLGAYVLEADLIKVNIERRRRAEASGEFHRRYTVRAGIEGTNSELKRAHGLGHLRVRGGLRVRLAVYLKALACNIKRMVQALLAAKFRRPSVAAAEAPVPALG